MKLQIISFALRNLKISDYISPHFIRATNIPIAGGGGGGDGTAHYYAAVPLDKVNEILGKVNENKDNAYLKQIIECNSEFFNDNYELKHKYNYKENCYIFDINSISQKYP